ncbi:sensor histidine kinase [Labrys neptuniae]
MALFKWNAFRRLHSSITVLAATLIGSVTTIMLLCAAALLIQFGGDDDGTWGAADVADALRQAVARNADGQLIVKPTARLDEIARDFPTFWYVVSDRNGEVRYGPVKERRPPKTPMSGEGTRFLSFAFDGTTRKIKKIGVVRDTPVGEVWIETGGVAYTATQLMLGTLTDATVVALPILIVLIATAFTAMVFVPVLIARPVRTVATAAEKIDGVPDGHRLPEQGVPAELVPLVSAFNRALSRIDHAAQAQRTFLSNAAHELRTPLTNARTALEQIQDPLLRNRLIAENQKLSSIVTMLLQLARISMEPAQLAQLDLAALARKITAEHVPFALKHGGEIEFSEPGHPVWVRGSEAAIGIALSNLIRNGVIHAGASGPILVEVAAAGGLKVIDSGPGLGPDQSDLSTGTFRRGNTKAEGVGLGLSIVSQVMTVHGGSIGVSETQGGGQRLN